MIDADTIHRCADSGLKPAIVEKFIGAIGAPGPFAVTIRAGERVILVPPPKSVSEAIELIRRYLGRAMIRVGVTQYPAGVGVIDAGELKPDVVDVCANIRMGTALFGKVYRIAVKRYGAPTDKAFGEAIDAWKTGYFDGTYVFDQPDPGSMPVQKNESDQDAKAAKEDDPARPASSPNNKTQQAAEPNDPNRAGIRVGLTDIGVGKLK